MQKFLIFIFILVILTMPAFSFAQTTLIPCGQSDANGVIAHPCGFRDVITLINRLINFALIKLALPIAAIMFAYAGVKLVTSGGSTEARSSAKNIFTNTAIGLALAAASYLIVKTILVISGYQSIEMFFK